MRYSIRRKKEILKIQKNNNQKRRTWSGLLILVVIVGGTTLLFYKTGLIGFFMNREKLITFLDSLGPLSFLGFILLQVIQVVASPIPGEATGLLGGFLYGPFLGLFLSTIGLTVGSYVAFILGRSFGRPFVERFVEQSIMRRFDYLLHHKGGFLIFILFLIPGFPKDYLCYFLGLGHLSTMEFLVIGGTGRLFGTILLSVGGTFIRNQQYKRFFILAGIAIVVVLLSMIYREKLERLFRIWHINEYRKRKNRDR